MNPCCSNVSSPFSDGLYKARTCHCHKQNDDAWDENTDLDTAIDGNSGQSVEVFSHHEPVHVLSGGCASICNASDLRIKGVFFIFIVLRVFCLYLLSFCSLQYIYKDLYQSYLSILSSEESQIRDKRISHSLSYLFDFTSRTGTLTNLISRVR